MSKGVDSLDPPREPAFAASGSLDPALTKALIQSHKAHSQLHSILSAQVAGTLTTIHTLVTEIIASSTKTQKAADGLKVYMTESAEKADSTFEHLRVAIETARQEQRQLVEHSTHLQEATAAARLVMGDQRELEGLGDRASTLGRRIRMVAMNTTIQAMRTGKEDETIKILAGEVSGLAGDVQKLGEELTESIDALSRRVDRDVINGVAKEAVATAKLSSAMASQVKELDSAYQQIKDFRLSVWNNVTASTHAINAHACQTASGLQHQDIARQRLEQIAQTLARMIQSDQQLTAALDGRASLPPDWAPVQAEELRSAYVMADQRAAHDGDDAAASTGPAIELF